jgi:hypothetical protein
MSVPGPRRFLQGSCRNPYVECTVCIWQCSGARHVGPVADAIESLDHCLYRATTLHISAVTMQAAIYYHAQIKDYVQILYNSNNNKNHQEQSLGEILHYSSDLVHVKLSWLMSSKVQQC